MTDLRHAPLGNVVDYKDQYDASLLFPISRAHQRASLGLSENLPFKGNDLWYAYEISWLDSKGKPEVAVGEFIVPCDSPNIVESKSFKLYLNSLNGTKFGSLTNVENTIARDLSKIAGAPVSVKIQCLSDMAKTAALTHFEGECLDPLPVVCDTYTVRADYLCCVGEGMVSETLYSNLLKSNCVKTGQPDWGSVQISYTGKPISREGLLKYIVSFRNYRGFHEDCVESIFLDIMKQCSPTTLTVEARYTRRGGIDINPMRTNAGEVPERQFVRLWRH